MTVTGTMMLRALYDTDLTPFDYESVNLARQAVDRPPGRRRSSTSTSWSSRPPATCPTACPTSEQAFVAEAARSGLLGPTFLTTRLRLKLSQSPALGGGCVVNTGAVRTWLELSHTPEAAQAEVIASTARAGDKWAGLGVRVNSVLQDPRPVLPRQYAPLHGPRTGDSGAAGDTIVRTAAAAGSRGRHRRGPVPGAAARPRGSPVTPCVSADERHLDPSAAQVASSSSSAAA